MRITVITSLILFCALVVGCQEKNRDGSSDERLVNSKLINTYSDIAIQNAIISEHTLFPYHFTKDGAELNELGQRDLAVLAEHLAKNGGHLNVRRLGASAGLYEARVNLVRQILQAAGVDMERITVSDSMPGGEGMSSERVLEILEQEPQSTGTEASISYSPETR